MHNVTVKYSMYLNRELLNSKEVKKIFKSIQNKKVLKSKGGFLFKSSIKEGEFHLGILPMIIEGERSRHYDIKLGFEDHFVFSGFFNVDGTIGFLFIPPALKEDLTESFKEHIKRNYKNTAGILLDHGLSKEMKLDWITQQMLTELGNFDTIPQCLKDFI